MRSFYVVIDALERGTSTVRTVYLADGPGADSYAAHGQAFEPALHRRPVRTIETFSEDLDGRVNYASATLQIDLSAIRAITDAASLVWRGTKITIWDDSYQTGPTAEPWFRGTISTARPDRDARILSIEAVVTRKELERNLLSLEFDGSDGLGGDEAKAGLLKPAGFGLCVNIGVVWFDEARNIGMLDGYGNLLSVQRCLEGGSSLGLPVANYANYAGLAAAIDAGTVPPGRWATSIADGLIGLGAPPAGVITCDATFGHGMPGQMISRVLQVHAGIPAGDISLTDLATLDADVPFPVRYWTSGQRSVGDLVERLAGSCNATPFVDFAARVRVTRPFGGTIVNTIDRAGETGIPALDWQTSEGQVPFWQLKGRCARPGVVLSRDEILYEDDLIPRGLYSATKTYRQGHIVALADKSQWLYVNATPGAGNAPPAWPTTSNAWWQNMEPPGLASSFKYADGTTIEALKPGEAGANVTEIRTAAAIAGQGALATQNTIGLATQATGLLPVANASAGLVNSNITIAANGTLAGGGGGAVTIGGLGYTGALNATFGAIAGASLYASNGSTLLSQADVKTIEGTASAITGQGALATANAVNLGSQVTGTLGVGNAAAALINTNITLAANGTLSGGGGGAVTIGGLGYTGALDATNDTGADTRNDDYAPGHYRNNWLRRLRTEFKLRAVIGSPAGSSGTYGTLESYAAWVDHSGGSVWQRFTDAAGVRFIRYSTGTSPTETWAGWEPEYSGNRKPVFGSDLLEASGGTVASLANFKTGLGTAAAIAGQGVLATANSVNLASQVTGALGTANAAAGLVNANITINAAGVLSGAGGGGVTFGGLGGGALGLLGELHFGNALLRESSGGATATLASFKTILGTASAITGQGSLATKSAADWRTDIVSRPALEALFYDFNYADLTAAQAAGHTFSGTSNISFVADGTSAGGRAMVLGDNVTAQNNLWIGAEWVPYNGTDLHEIAFDVEFLACDAAALTYLGVQAHDRAGNNLGVSYNYVAASALNQSANAGRKTLKGFLSGFTTAAGSGLSNTPSAPAGLPDGSAGGFGQGGAVKFRPMAFCNLNSKAGSVKVHAVRVTRIAGRVATQDEVSFGSVYLKESAGGTVASLANFKTGLGTAAAIAGQGALATANSVNLASQVTGALGTANAAAGLVNANITIAANGALSGGGGGAVTFGGLGGGAVGQLPEVYFGQALFRETSGGAVASLANFKTASGTAAAIAGQSTWATYSATLPAKLEGIETAADVTSMITGTPEIVVECDHTGAALSGQLPRAVPFKLLRNGADVSTSAAWTRTGMSGTQTSSIGAASGALTITDLTTAEAIIRLQAVYSGTTRTMDVKVRKSLAPPPVTGGGGTGTSATDSTLSSVSSNSMVVVSDELTVTTGSAGQVALAAPVNFQASTFTIGSYGLKGIWQRWNGSAWVDLGTETSQSSEALVELEYPEYYYTAGSLTVNHTATGLGSGTSQKFRLMCRTNSGTVTRTLTGTVSATGS